MSTIALGGANPKIRIWINVIINIYYWIKKLILNLWTWNTSRSRHPGKVPGISLSLSRKSWTGSHFKIGDRGLNSNLRNSKPGTAYFFIRDRELKSSRLSGIRQPGLVQGMRFAGRGISRLYWWLKIFRDTDPVPCRPPVTHEVWDLKISAMN